MLCMQTSDSSAIGVFCRTQHDTEQLAQRMAACCPEAAVLYLRGELGAGKSAFARAFLQALGVAGPIKSPTYTLLECYSLANNQLAVHMDLYRISDPDELEYLALDDMLPDSRVLLVEWPDVGFSRLPAADVRIDISQKADGRQLQLTPVSVRAGAWLQHVIA
jgi:tRNA threonylcarbamoyladenosine biosynthesis protein TsaE